MTIFKQQCDVVEDKVAVKAKPGVEVILNPSDVDASYANRGWGGRIGPDIRLAQAFRRLPAASPANCGQNPLAARTSPTPARHRLVI